MTVESSLRQNLLTALGTCDFLHELTGWDMRRKLEYTLMMGVWNRTCSESAVQKFIAFFPRESRPESAWIHENPTVLNTNVFDDSVSLDEDFQFADHFFQIADPDFPNANQDLLHAIHDQIDTLFDPGRTDLDSSDASMSNLSAKQFAEVSQAPAGNKEDQREDESATGKKETKSSPDDSSLSSSALQEDLRQLDALTGLEEAKNEIHTLCDLLQISRLRQSRGLKSAPAARHLIFSGNPGTGKTTTARIVARIYKDLGFLSRGTFVECTRGDLVGEYIGSTAMKTKKVIDKAIGGVLFIDEAYALARSSERDFGHEAIEVLLREMENHRDDLVVIAAGYPAEMDRFLDSNPGLRSRFTTCIHFEDFLPDQLFSIFEHMARALDYTLSPAAAKKAGAYFQQLTRPAPKGFANARDVRTMLEKAISRQAVRLVRNPDLLQLSSKELQTLESEDLPF